VKGAKDHSWTWAFRQ